MSVLSNLGADMMQRRSNGQFQWVMRFNFRIPSEEELRRLVSPESVSSLERFLF